MKKLSKAYQASLIKDLKKLLPKFKIGHYYSNNDAFFKGKSASFGFRVWTSEREHVCEEPGVHYYVIKNNKCFYDGCIPLCVPHDKIIKTLLKFAK